MQIHQKIPSETPFPLENELLFPVSQVSQKWADPTQRNVPAVGRPEDLGAGMQVGKCLDSPSPEMTCMPRPLSQASGSPPFPGPAPC